MHLFRLLRTLRHLRARQVFGQLALRLVPASMGPAAASDRLPVDEARPKTRLKAVGDWLHPDAESRSEADLLAGRLSFVGIERRSSFPPDWDATDAPRLWRYNLHYHSFLFDLEFEEAREVVLDYIEHQNRVKHAEGWEPYPLSLRMVNWVALFWGRWREQTQAAPRFEARLWLEVRRMASQLMRRLEFHLMANHLLENAVALSFAGATFEGADAEQWRAEGFRLLRSELREQVLGDGMHYERSPMYQARILYTLGLLWNTGDEELAGICTHRIRKMASALEVMTHPDGGIALFNDSALGVYPQTSKLLDWLHEIGALKEPAQLTAAAGTVLQDAGYFAACTVDGDAVFMDFGDIGPAYQPGHAHADFLSVEFSAGAQRLIVDGGNKEYDETADRQFARSAKAHSTIIVDGEEPLELWGSFRVGRRGRAVLDEHHQDKGGIHLLRASHNGYTHLSGRPVARRELRWDPSGMLELRDSVTSPKRLPCISQLIIDGTWELDRIDSKSLRFSHEGTEVLVCASSPIEFEETRWFPHFGVEAQAHRLYQSFSSGRDEPATEWTLLVSRGSNRSSKSAAMLDSLQARLRCESQS
ncbi:MAG: putative heparinase superfamily protein [Planctomycetota bacterium]|jgi:uncharacterized heparinase superfamily protein